jgi:hypothetical protein
MTKPDLTAVVPVERVLELAKRVPVFPCRRRDEADQSGRTLRAKSPLTSNGFKAATQDEAQIRRWWSERPDALVGVPTGSTTRIVAVDYDHKSAGQAAQDWIAEHQDVLISTRVHQTGGGSGGRHYLFSLPPGVKIRGGVSVTLGKVRRDGLDIRAEGGYIVWWPLHFGQQGPVGDIQPLPAGLIDERRMDLELPAEVAKKLPPKPGTSQDFQRDLPRLTEALAYIDPTGYDAWLMVGMALHHASGGADDGLELWDSWSCGGITGELPASYAGRADIEYRWQSFHLDRGGGVTLGSLFNAAKAGGWVPVSEAVRLGPPPREEPPQHGYDDTPEARGMERVREPDVTTLSPGAANATPGLRVELRHVADIVEENREPEWLLHHVIEAKVVAVLAGPRASFKSFIALDWAMRIAVAGNPVALLSGEGGGLGRRVKAWMQTFGGGQDLRGLPILALERPLNLNREEEMAMLVEAMDKANIRPTLVVIDTLSKFSAGMDENSNQEVAAYLAAVSRFIRERYDASVLIVAHSGHGDADRPRGASALMANPDSEFIVKRAAQPNTHVEVTRQRFKDTGELPNLAYEAEVIDLGAADRYGERLTSLVMRQSVAQGEKPISAQAPQGKAQRTILLALRERQKRSETPVVWTVEELRQIGRECGISRQSVHDAVEKLVMSPFLTATVGGSRLTNE